MSDSHPLLSIIEIENRRRQLVDYLGSSASPSSQWRHLSAFFELLLQQPDQSRFQSYFAEFAAHCIRLSDPSVLKNNHPQKLEWYLQLLSHCRTWMHHSEWQDKLSGAENLVRQTAALSYLYVGAGSDACRILGWDLESHPGQAEWASALALCEQAESRGLAYSREMSHAMQWWRHEVSGFAADQVNVILVEQERTAADMQARILQLHVQARERPSDAEEDAVRINNTITAGSASLYYTFNDAVRSANDLVFSRQDRDTYYSYNFSFSDKDAEFSGHSIGLAAGLLAFSGRHNRHYRRPVVRLCRATAVVGKLAPDGRVSGVDEHGLAAKLEAAFFSPLQRIYVPTDNLVAAFAQVNRLKSRYPGRYLDVAGIELLQQAVHDRNLVEKNNPSLILKSVAAVQRTRHKTPVLLAVLALLLLLLFSQVRSLQWWLNDPVPTKWEAAGSTFIMFDQYGNRLWKHDFPYPLDGISFDPEKVVVDDLDGDGRQETIIGIQTPKFSQFSSRFFCFSDKGESLWPPLKFGRAVHTKSNKLIKDFFGAGVIKTARIYPNRPKMVMATVGHFNEFVGIIALIDSRGRIQGEYWNSGQIFSLEAVDLDQDSVKEIIFGPWDNESGRARLAVLDPRDMHGASPQQDDRFSLRDFPAGTQTAYLRFPPSPYMDNVAYRDVVRQIYAIDNNIRVDIGCLWQDPQKSIFEQPGMYNYELSPDLDCIDMAIPDYFRSEFIKKFHRKLSVQDEEELKKIECWDGEKWMLRRPEPAP